jgi:hypothetical protein
MANNYIYHHGVLGMKWGVRRYQNKDGSLTAAGKKRLADDDDSNESKKSTETSSSSTPAKKTIKDLSDDELRARINRLQMERQYSDLVKSLTPETKQKSSEFVNGYLKPATKKILWDTSVDIGAQAVKHMIAKSVNKAIKEEAVFANNKKK